MDKQEYPQQQQPGGSTPVPGPQRLILPDPQRQASNSIPEANDPTIVVPASALTTGQVPPPMAYTPPGTAGMQTLNRPGTQALAPRKSTRGLRLLLACFAAIAVAGLIGGLVLGAMAVTGNNRPQAPQVANKPTTQANPTATPIPTATPTPMPTATPLPTPTTTTATVMDVTISPARFILPTSCQRDNGYRCTMLLIAGKNVAKRTAWSISLGDDNVQQGTISANQQEQVIIYIRHQCPFQETLTVTIKKQQTDVPFSCG